MRISATVLVLLISHLVSARLPDLIPYRKGEIWGYCDSTKKIAIEPRWEACTFFYGNRATVKANGRWGVIDGLGKYVLEPKWEECYLQEDHSMIVKSDGKYGMVDSLGNYKLQPKYHDLYPLSPTRFVAYENKNHCGVIDDHDSVIVPFKARWITHDADSVLGCAFHGEMFVCDLNGKPILKEHEYLDMDGGLGEGAKFGLFVVIRKSDCGKWRDNSTDFIVVDTADRQVFPGKYDWIELHGDTMFECIGNDTTIFFDLHGNPLEYVPSVDERIAGRKVRPWYQDLEIYPVSQYVYNGHNGCDYVFMGYKDQHGTEYWEN